MIRMDIPVNSVVLLFLSVTIVASANGCLNDYDCPDLAECFVNTCLCKYGSQSLINGKITSCKKECDYDYECPKNAECSSNKCQCKYGGRFPLTGKIISCSNECSYDFNCVTNAKCRNSMCVCDNGDYTRFNGKLTYCPPSSLANGLGIALGISGTVIFIIIVLLIVLRARRLRMLRAQTTTYVQTPAVAHGVPIAAQSYPAMYPIQQYHLTPPIQGHNNAGYHPSQQPPPYTPEDNK